MQRCTFGETRNSVSRDAVSKLPNPRRPFTQPSRQILVLDICVDIISLWKSLPWEVKSAINNLLTSDDDSLLGLAYVS